MEKLQRKLNEIEVQQQKVERNLIKNNLVLGNHKLEVDYNTHFRTFINQTVLMENNGQLFLIADAEINFTTLKVESVKLLNAKMFFGYLEEKEIEEAVIIFLTKNRLKLLFKTSLLKGGAGNE